MKLLPALLLTAAGLAAPACAVAGPFNDTLAVCLVKNTSEQDRTLLVRWVFAAMAAHPDVKELSKVSPAQAEQLNKDVAALFWALVAERCGDETREAVKYEGSDTIASSFEVLGKVAFQGLMADAGVNKYMQDMAANLDEDKLKALFSTPDKQEPTK